MKIDLEKSYEEKFYELVEDMDAGFVATRGGVESDVIDLDLLSMSPAATAIGRRSPLHELRNSFVIVPTSSIEKRSLRVVVLRALEQMKRVVANSRLSAPSRSRQPSRIERLPEARGLLGL